MNSEKHVEIMTRMNQTAWKFKSSIIVSVQNRYIDAKSLLGLYASISVTEEHQLHVHGEDREEATTAMVDLFNQYGIRVTVVQSL